MRAGGETEEDLCVEGLLPLITFPGLRAESSLEVPCEFLSTTDTEEGSLLLLLTLSIFMVSACIEAAVLLQ